MLVNNAGSSFGENTARLTMERFDECMDINVKAALKMTQEGVQHLEKAGTTRGVTIV